jgi:co-chaperonin GroES (HSP10)
MTTTQRLMHHEEDPAALIIKKIGNLDNITIFGNRILLGVYERPAKTKSGIILTDQTRREDEYQGKAALVLKKGPTAFVSDANYDFNGQDVEIGDWVAIFVSDGRQLVVNGQLCRLVEDQHIRLKIPAPDIVF